MPKRSGCVVNYAGDDGQRYGYLERAVPSLEWTRRRPDWPRDEPHATDTCGSDLLRACAARARELDVPITTHLAQSQAEVATIGRRYGGRTPAEYLDWRACLRQTFWRALHQSRPVAAIGKIWDLPEAQAAFNG